MAKKSKTQKAKASARRQEKKVEREQEDTKPVIAEEAPKKKFFGKSNKADATEKKVGKKVENERAAAKKDEKKASRSTGGVFGFFSDVRSEMKRVTWPSRQDVVRWSGVVVVALIFFGLFCVVLDDWVVTPVLYAISSLGA